MSHGAIWLAFALAGAVTFWQRSLFFWLSEQASERLLPPPVQRALRYVAPAAFAAISAPRIVDGSSLSSGLTTTLFEVVVDARFLAAVLASLIMWRTGKLPLMLLTGMVLFWLLRGLGL